MSTVSQLFGLSPQEHAAAVFTSLGEAGPGQDLYGPYSTLLNRKNAGYGNSLVSIATAPGQFVANSRYTPAQVADPNFGRKVYGARYDQAYNSLNDPTQLAPAFNQLQGATSFRGQAALNVKQKSDTMLNPKGNFYFDRNQGAFQKGNALLQTATSPTPGTNVNQQTGNVYNYYITDSQDQPQDPGQQFLSYFAKQMTGVQPQFDPISALKSAATSVPVFESGLTTR